VATASDLQLQEQQLQHSVHLQQLFQLFQHQQELAHANHLQPPAQAQASQAQTQSFQVGAGLAGGASVKIGGKRARSAAERGGGSGGQKRSGKGGKGSSGDSGGGGHAGVYDSAVVLREGAAGLGHRRAGSAPVAAGHHSYSGGSGGLSAPFPPGLGAHLGCGAAAAPMSPPAQRPLAAGSQVDRLAALLQHAADQHRETSARVGDGSGSGHKRSRSLEGLAVTSVAVATASAASAAAAPAASVQNTAAMTDAAEKGAASAPVAAALTAEDSDNAHEAELSLPRR